MDRRQKKAETRRYCERGSRIDSTLQPFLLYSKGDKSIEFICSYLCFRMLYYVRFCRSFTVLYRILNYRKCKCTYTHTNRFLWFKLRKFINYWLVSTKKWTFILFDGRWHVGFPNMEWNIGISWGMWFQVWFLLLEPTRLTKF